MTKYFLRPSPHFKRDYKRLKRKHIQIKNLGLVFKLLEYHHVNLSILRAKYDDHALTGNEKGNCELHLAPNILLKYQIHHKDLVLILLRLGSHSGKNSIFK